MARTSDDPRKGLTAFLFDRDQPGWRIVRRIPIMGPEEHGGHCELEFDGLEDRRRERAAGRRRRSQGHADPARSGATDALHALARAREALRSRSRSTTSPSAKAAARRLADRESVRELLGDAAMQIEIGRLLTMRAAGKLDRGDFARKEVSMAKVVVADALQQAADTGDPAVRRARLFEGHGARVDLPVRAAGAARRRRLRGARDGPRAVAAWTSGNDFWRWDDREVSDKTKTDCPWLDAPDALARIDSAAVPEDFKRAARALVVDGLAVVRGAA